MGLFDQILGAVLSGGTVQLAAGGINRSLHVVSRAVDASVQIELDRDGRGAERTR